MHLKLMRSYPKLEDGKQKLDSKGQPIIVFAYRVTGTKAELSEFEAIQKKGDHNCKDENGYYYCTTRPVGLKGTLSISTNGKLFTDTTNLDLAAAMIKNYGAVGHIMAKDLIANGLDSDEPVIMQDTSKLAD